MTIMNGLVDNQATARFFDSMAGDYDRDFARSMFGQELRAIVWERLAAHFKPGDRVLELNCGTGEDAVWLAKRGVRVLATDVSTKMVNLTLHKANANGVTSMIETRVLDIAAPGSEFGGLKFDGVLSNFGGLNCARDLGPLVLMLAAHVVPRGTLVLVFMGRYCAWEMAYHFLHLRAGAAFRRLRPVGAQATRGPHVVRVWYPTTQSLRRTLEPWFEEKRIMGLGTFLPPTHLAPVVLRRPRLYRMMLRLEHRFAPRFPFNLVGDHTICEYQRTGEVLPHDH